MNELQRIVGTSWTLRVFRLCESVTPLQPSLKESLPIRRQRPSDLLSGEYGHFRPTGRALPQNI
jgi:hypothetical protein